MLEKVLERRKQEREQVITQAREFTEKLANRFGRVTVILFGSYARGDFNLWSDVDLIVVCEQFRNVRFLDRYDLFMDILPPRFQVIPWTPEEAQIQFRKSAWREALKVRIVLRDDFNLTRLLE